MKFSLSIRRGALLPRRSGSAGTDLLPVAADHPEGRADHGRPTGYWLAMRPAPQQGAHRRYLFTAGDAEADGGKAGCHETGLAGRAGGVAGNYEGQLP
jgi:hypothetical protein